MNLPHVISCGVYRHAQKYRQLCNFSGLSLSLTGRIRTTQFYADGQLKFDQRGNEPTLHLVRTGEVSDFEYGPNRENWVMMFDAPCQEYDPDIPGYCFQDDAYGRIAIPPLVHIPPQDISAIREQFAAIQRHVQSDLPQERLAADLIATGIFSLFLAPEIHDGKPSHAQKLRALIDDDANWQQTLLDLSRQCGLHHDYLRREFLQLYGRSPQQYRQERRIKRIIHLFTYTDLSLKEIAFAVGMKNVTHLNALLRKHLDATPSEIRAKYRAL